MRTSPRQSDAWRVLGALLYRPAVAYSAGTMKKKGSQQMGKHVKSFVTEVKKNRALFVMAMPAFLLVLIMQYLPMSGLVLAFKNYRYDLGVFGSEWNGFANFEYLFSSGTGWLITKNTVVYNLLNLVTSQLIAV